MGGEIMKKIFISLLFFASYNIFAAPVSPQNGGTGVSNNSLLFVNRQVSLDGSSSSALSINSPNQGSRVWPQLSHATGVTIPTPENGLTFWDTSQNTLDLWNGSEWQYLLTAQNVTGSGSITVTNTNGVLDIFGAGGVAPDAAYSSFSTQSNSFATTFPAINTFKPVVLGTVFSEDKSTDFSNSFMTIDSVSTPVMTYTGATTQSFSVSESFSIRGAISTNTTFKFCIAKRTAAGVVTVTQYCQVATINNLIDFIPGPQLNANIELAQGDSVFCEVQNITNTNSIYAAFGNFSTGSVAGSIANTNGLPQGSSNKYLSIDGGTTLASATGTINNGHLAQFSGTSGLVSDANISTANVIQSTGSYANPAWITSLASSKITGLSPSALVGTDVSGNLTNNVQNITPNIGGLGIVNNFSPLVGSQTALQFSSSLLYGNYLGLGNFGPYLGIDSTTNGLFITGNAYYDATSSGFFRFNTGASGGIRVNAAGVQLQHMVTGPSFTAASFVDDLSIDGLGNINLPNIAASSLLATDGSKNIIAATGSYNINAATATQATNSTNVATTQTTTNANYFPLFVASSTNSNQAANLGTGWSYNPSTRFINLLGMNSPTGTNGANLTVQAGAASSTGIGGGTFITGGGAGASGTAGDVTITGGSAGTSGIGGNTRIRGGTATSGAAGAVIFDQGNVLVSSGLTLTTSIFNQTNGGQIRANNSTGTSELVLYGRFTDNMTYMDIGSAGAKFRQNSAGSTWMSVTSNSNVTFDTGDVFIGTAGKTTTYKSGTNACTGTQALSGASTIITTTCAKTGDLLILSIITPGGTPGAYSYTISNGVSATVTSTLGAGDTSTLRYLFIHTN